MQNPRWQEWGLLHDIKGPLTSIQLAIGEICADPQVALRFDWQVGVVKDGLDQLGEMLDESRSDHFYDIGAETLRVINVLKPMASVQAVGIEFDLIHHAVRADGGAFRRVLYNLVLNAIECFKLSTVEQPLISISLQFDANRIILAVKDNGPGCDLTDSGDVFSLGVSTKGEKRGQGLAVTKFLVEEILHGQLSVISSNTGSCFRVTFPVD